MDDLIVEKEEKNKKLLKILIIPMIAVVLILTILILLWSPFPNALTAKIDSVSTMVYNPYSTSIWEQYKSIWIEPDCKVGLGYAVKDKQYEYCLFAKEEEYETFYYHTSGYGTSEFEYYIKACVEIVLYDSDIKVGNTLISYISFFSDGIDVGGAILKMKIKDVYTTRIVCDESMEIWLDNSYKSFDRGETYFKNKATLLTRKALSTLICFLEIFDMEMFHQ